MASAADTQSTAAETMMTPAVVSVTNARALTACTTAYVFFMPAISGVSWHSSEASTWPRTMQAMPPAHSRAAAE
jgi:hypothetical protein